MSSTRKTLMGVIAAGIAMTAAGAGTFASFSASTSNAGSTFETGTLVLSSQKDSATACLSSDGSGVDTNTNDCDELFALTVRKPGDAATVDVTLAHEGSIDASTLQAFASSACVPADAAGGSVHGTGDPCTSIDLYVQEFSDSGRTTPSVCHYGGGTATTCAYDATSTLGTFEAAHADAGSGLGLGAATAGASRYFTVGIQMDPTADNSVQGRQATFGFTWQLVQ